MTEQTNPTAGEEETTQAPTETQESVAQESVAQEPVAQESAAQEPVAQESAAQEPATQERQPAPRPEARRAEYDDDDEDEYDGDDDEYEDEYEDDQDEDDDLYVEGPAEYVQRERGGRGRRIGGDVRPDEIDYKNIALLSRFLDRRGRILSRRKTRVSARVQRRIVKAIKRARYLALLPYTGEHTRIVRKRR